MKQDLHPEENLRAKRRCLHQRPRILTKPNLMEIRRFQINASIIRASLAEALVLLEPTDVAGSSRQLQQPDGQLPLSSLHVCDLLLPEDA